MSGTLVPPWFQVEPPGENDLAIACVTWGVSLACAVYCAAHAFRQTRRSWERTRWRNTYVVLIWLEWAANVVIGVITWCLLRGYYGISFEFLFAGLSLWCIQIHCLFQIIINRISVVQSPDYRAGPLKWGVFGLVFAINVSVFAIWIPAKLQISETYIRINETWDRVEKALICLIDLSLNVYFLYLVRTKLIANGLRKYERLYWFNLVLTVISVSSDVLLIGMMSLRNDIVYLQFHGLIYLIKLQIEMTIADLVVKIARLPHLIQGSSFVSSPDITRLDAKSGQVWGATTRQVKTGDRWPFRLVQLSPHEGTDIDLSHHSSWSATKPAVLLGDASHVRGVVAQGVPVGDLDSEVGSSKGLV